jgi:hypothetical protein
MKGYVNIPKTIYVIPCMECGARPVVAVAGEDGYVVKCPNNDHYQTPPGIIDLDNWNAYNKNAPTGDYNAGLIPSVRG